MLAFDSKVDIHLLMQEQPFRNRIEDDAVQRFTPIFLFLLTVATCWHHNFSPLTYQSMLFEIMASEMCYIISLSLINGSFQLATGRLRPSHLYSLFVLKITLRRTWGKMSLWHRAKFLYYIIFQSIFLPSPEELNQMVCCSNGSFPPCYYEISQFPCMPLISW